jgi:hypothetical protein
MTAEWGKRNSRLLNTSLPWPVQVVFVALWLVWIGALVLQAWLVAACVLVAWGTIMYLGIELAKVREHLDQAQQQLDKAWAEIEQTAEYKQRRAGQEAELASWLAEELSPEEEARVIAELEGTYVPPVRTEHDR